MSPLSDAEVRGRLLTAEEDERRALTCILRGRADQAELQVAMAESELASLKRDLNDRGLAIQ